MVIDRLDIEDLISLPWGPNLHPNGFVQLRLNEDATRKLHVWPGVELPTQDADQTIHDHVFAMRRAVLCGELTNVDIKTEFADDGEFSVWRQTGKCRDAHQIVQGGSSILAPSKDRMNVIGRVETIARAGDTYEFPALSFHDNYATTLTATIMEKTQTVGGTARVLVPFGKRPSTEVFEHNLPTEILWNIIAAALELQDLEDFS